MKELQYYRVRSRRWRFGYVLARSALHAVTVATATGLHKQGKAITVWRTSVASAPDEVQRLAREGQCGRVLCPHPLRNHYLLIYPTDELAD